MSLRANRLYELKLAACLDYFDTVDISSGKSAVPMGAKKLLQNLSVRKPILPRDLVEILLTGQESLIRLSFFDPVYETGRGAEQLGR